MHQSPTPGLLPKLSDETDDGKFPSLIEATDQQLSDLLDTGLAPVDQGKRPIECGGGTSWTAPETADLNALLPGYDVIAMLGRGGMGAVYQAVHRRLKRRVALKVLPAEMSEEPGIAARFRREAQTMAQLDHASIVDVYDCGETDVGHLYYAMEFVEGEDLAARAAREPALSVEESLEILKATCDALSVLHECGIVHRDVKPANILLAEDGILKLADFGLAASVEREMLAPGLTRPGSMLGTLEYAAPEQLSRSSPAGPATDIYSLGVIAYELLTGERPRGVFDPPSVRNTSLDPAFDGVILRAMQSDPERRFATAAAFREALVHAADRRRQQVLRETEFRRRLARRAQLVALFAMAALLTAGLAVFAWSERGRAISSQSAAAEAQAKTEDLIQFLLTDLRTKLEPTGKLDAMESVLERAVDFYREKDRAAGHSSATALDLSRVLVIKADVIGVRGLDDEAGALYTEAIGLVERERDRSPAVIAHTFALIEALRDRSEHRMTMGRYPDALADAERMLWESEAAAKVTQHTEQTVKWLASSHAAIGNALGYLEQLGRSAEAYKLAQALYRSLLTESPEDSGLANTVAGFEASLGSIAEAQGKFEEMLAHFKVYHDYILHRHGKETVAYSYAAFRMGVAMNKTARFAEAVPYLSDAVRLAQADLEQRPGHTGAMNHLRWCLGELAKSYEGSGEVETAHSWRGREAGVLAAMESAKR